MKEVVWLENPNKFDYLREGVYGTTERSGKPSLESASKIVGYENVEKSGKGIQAYDRRVWWLRKSDLKNFRKDEEQEIKPTEAVEPENINIPPEARVTEAYKAKTSVRVTSSKKERNEEWEKCENNEEPFLIVDKKRKYASVRYDMYNTPYNLTEEAVKELEETFESFLDSLNSSERKQIFKDRPMASFGETKGRIKSIRTHEAKILAEKLKKIVMNEDNWVEISFGQDLPFQSD